MSLDLKSIARGALAAMFGLGTDVAPAVTFYRPPGFMAVTGLVAPAEVVCPGQMLVSGYRPFALWAEPEVLLHETVIIRAQDLAAVSGPGAGDYLVDAAGQRRDVLSARYDAVGDFWLFHTLRTNNEDFGGLAAHVGAEDRGDLTAASAFDDWGTIA